MPFEPIQGTPVRFPPGRVAIRLRPELLRAYKLAYARAATDLAGLPALRERDFDGRTVKLTQAQLDRLNAALARYAAPARPETGSVYEAQERYKTRLFKRLQFLS